MVTKQIKILFLLLLVFQSTFAQQNAPVASNDSNSTFVNTTLNENAPGVLSNDTDVDGDPLIVTQFIVNGITFNAGDTATITQGTISIFSDGSYIFTPNTNFVGNVDLINYTISDGALTSSADLTLSVNHPPTAPEANDDSRTMFVNTNLNESAPGLLINDSDINGDVINITQYTINGTVYNAGDSASFNQGGITILADGSFFFTPTKDFVGNVDVINYTVSDGSLTSSANLLINVIFPPTAPEAINDYDTADINTTLNVSLPGVLINDTDVNGDTLIVSEFLINGNTYNVGQTVNLVAGSFTLNQDGSYVLVPSANFIGELPRITYTITDGTFTATAILFITVEPTQDLLEVTSFSSCNQGFTANGEYRIRYTAIFRNRSNAKNIHEPSIIRNIDVTNNLENVFGNGCVIAVDQINVSNNDFTQDYVNGGSFPNEFNNNTINDDFRNVTSTSILNTTSINNFALYPRQTLNVSFCVIVNPFCNGRPNPTPSGSGIDFNNIINVTTNKGNISESSLITDFHTTEAVVTAGLFVPEFNNDTPDPPGVVNPDGTYDYDNRVIITNEGTATANNVNFNMGLGSFLDNGIVFTQIRITQVSGPTVTINPSYDGNTETNLLTTNNSLAAGEKIILELSYLIEPYNSQAYSFFNQLDRSMTQGALDGFDETTAVSIRRYSFVTWSDNLGNHLDRYYRTTSATDSLSSSLQCDCTTIGMRFLYNSSSSVEKIISNVEKIPNGILEYDEFTFQITIRNTSESVELRNLQLEDNLTTICNGNIIDVSTPTIVNSTAITNPNLNINFNGTTDINIFDGTSGVLGANETIAIEFSVILSEDCFGDNTTTFTSREPFNVVSSTISVGVTAFTDSDGDGIINSIDLDDDNDTILDITETNGLDPLADDDADLLPNYRDTDFGIDANGDGIVDIFDFDNDGVPNHLDLDSDNDGILDIVEAGNASVDTNNNGRTNTEVGANGLDNSLETNDTATANNSFILPNTDANGNPDYVDIDSDDDGIVDNIEAQLTASYIAPNLIYTEAGIDTAFLNGITLVDTDNDLIFDYLDINSDNDIRNDVIEAWDINADGISETVFSNIDADNDGLDDAFDNNINLVNPTNNQTPLSFPNEDNPDNSERDWREIIAIVILIDNISETEGNDFIFNLSLVTKRDNSIPVQSATPIVFDFTTTNGTTTATTYQIATSPFDFTGFSSVNFTIPAFTDTSTFTVTSLEDTIFEIDELFTLTGNITSNNTINTEIIGVGTILDNDVAPSITMNNARADEGIDLTYTISISHPSSRPIEIQINTTDNEARDILDYIGISEIITITETVDPNNANIEASFTITTLLDNLNEPDEEILNVIGSVVPTSIVDTQDLTKTGTIVDVDPNPLIEISSHKVEEGQDITFTISLLNANNELMQNYAPINIVLETIDNTTTANQDYQAFSILTEIPALTSTITRLVTTVDDKLNEKTESFNLQITVNLANVANSVMPFGVGTLVDNDYPNLFSPNNDGRSDVFEISGVVEEYPNFKLQIFNRLGDEVYQYSNNGNQNPVWWDGTFNGKRAPVGVYYYILDYNDGTRKPKNGFVQLIR
uniref:cadherin-like domain-containing protein n=1 Tax=uncultured Polaribacter sp. TaxID=174711 RepID=UPI002607BF5A|nr:Ig-like domain-containing protein [uncultured Polaribacter sp.]